MSDPLLKALTQAEAAMRLAMDRLLERDAILLMRDPDVVDALHRALGGLCRLRRDFQPDEA